MPKSPEPTSSTATRQIRPPPISQQLSEFASQPDAAGALGSLPRDPACNRDVHQGRARTLLTLVPLMPLLLSYPEIWPERDRRRLRCSVAALGIRSRRSHIKRRLP